MSHGGISHGGKRHGLGETSSGNERLEKKQETVITQSDTIKFATTHPPAISDYSLIIDQYLTVVGTCRFWDIMKNIFFKKNK